MAAYIYKTSAPSMFHDLFSGQLQLFHLNFGTITLLPKKTEAVRIEQFRPICLLNVSSKIFTKVGTNRLTQIAHSVVLQSQTAFMPDRNILEGVVVQGHCDCATPTILRWPPSFRSTTARARNRRRWSRLKRERGGGGAGKPRDPCASTLS